MLDRFHAAAPFRAYLDSVRENQDLWRGVYDRARLPAKAGAQARAVRGAWRLLALSEDWCGDAANILPVAARLAESSPDLELRVLSRDENLDLMDAHLTNGRSRSIPVIMLLDVDGRERGWWGPRPASLQKWVMEEGMKMEPGPRYREVRRFYARDKGQSIVEELLALLRKAEQADVGPRMAAEQPTTTAGVEA